MSLHAPAPWAPPNLRGTPDASAYWNALVSHLGRALPLRGTGQAQVDLAEPPPGDAHAVALRFATGPEVLLVPLAFPFATLFEADLAVADLPLLPDALRAALAEGIVDALAALLPDHGLGTHAVRTVGPVGALATGAPRRWLRASVAGFAAEPAAVLVGIEAAALGTILDGAQAPQALPGLRATLTREADFTLGRLALPLAALRRLVPGTVVVLDAGAIDVRLRVGDGLFRFEPAGDGWACTGVETLAAPPDRAVRPPGDPTRTDIPMPEPAPSAPGTLASDTPGDLPADPLGRLDVALDLDLGRINVPLAELETWGPGSIVALRPPEAGPGVEVVLRANGRAIGAGEIVRIDDRLAVRLTRLMPL